MLIKRSAVESIHVVHSQDFIDDNKTRTAIRSAAKETAQKAVKQAAEEVEKCNKLLEEDNSES
jgi:hypothetical protein